MEMRFIDKFVITFSLTYFIFPFRQAVYAHELKGSSNPIDKWLDEIFLGITLLLVIWIWSKLFVHIKKEKDQKTTYRFVTVISSFLLCTNCYTVMAYV
jgi:glycerol uptake facilitator-like aquaporin